MIAIIDLACTKFSHEMFNAGTITQVHLAFPQDKIVYFAETEQISCVKRILNETLDNQNIPPLIEFAPITHDLDGSNEAVIIQEVIEKNITVKSILITSFISMQMYELQDIIKRNTHIKFVFLLHGIIEYLIEDKEKLHYRLPLNINISLALRQFHIVLRRFMQKKTPPQDIFSFRESLQQLAILPNVNLIAFSNEYQNYYTKISKDITNKINKFYLPYVYDFAIKDKPFTDTVKIGIMPSSHQASDGYARSLAYYAYLHSRSKRTNFLFEIVNGDNSWKCMGKYVHINNKRPLDRHELNKILHDCDWVLLPYGKEKYKLSSSGILFDAINMQVPCLMGPSHCFNDFDDSLIGIHASNYSSLKKNLLQIIKSPDRKKYHEFRKNIRKLKYEMNNYNIEAFKKLLS